MKYLIVAIICVITFTATSAQTTSPVNKVNVQPVRMNAIALITNPTKQYNAGACCLCIYRITLETQQLQPAVDMYIRHYFGFNYWE